MNDRLMKEGNIMKKLNKILVTLIIIMLMFGYAVPGAYAYGKANIDVRSSTIREAAALTTSYVAGSAIQIKDRNQLNLLVSFTVGSSTGCKIKVDVRDEDSSTWYQLQAASVSAAGLVTLTDAEYTKTATKDFVIDLPVGYFEVRVSAKALTSGTNTSMSIVLMESTH